MTCTCCGARDVRLFTAQRGWRACLPCLVKMVDEALPAEPVRVRGLFTERPETCRHGRRIGERCLPCDVLRAGTRP